MDIRKDDAGNLVIQPLTQDEEKFLDALLEAYKAWENLKPAYEAIKVDPSYFTECCTA